MTELRRFALRYHHVKKAMEDLEEQRLVQLNNQYRALSEAAIATEQERLRAQIQRNASMTGAHWLMWQQYVQSIETTAKERQQDLDAVGQQREVQRQALWSAHRETSRWSNLVSELTRRDRLDMQRNEATAADELAVLRTNKGGQ